MDGYTDKKTARRYFLDLRASLTSEELTEQSQALCKAIMALPEFHRADTLLLFFPTRNEPDLSCLAERALALGKAVAYPISHTETCTLSFHSVGSLSELTPSTYGIPEPSPSAPEPALTDASLCVVPALAYDRRGYRLGYGKGYYDRFLKDFCGTSIGVALDGFLCHTLPVGEHDIPLDILITETGVTYTDEASFS